MLERALFWYNIYMNNDIVADLKQSITTTVSQQLILQTAELRKTLCEDIITGLRKDIGRLAKSLFLIFSLSATCFQTQSTAFFRFKVATATLNQKKTAILHLKAALEMGKRLGTGSKEIDDLSTSVTETIEIGNEETYQQLKDYGRRLKGLQKRAA